MDPGAALEKLEIKEHTPERFFDALQNVVTGGTGSKPGVKAAGPPPKVMQPAQHQQHQQQPRTPTGKPSGIKIISRSISQEEQHRRLQERERQEQQQQQQQQQPKPQQPQQPQQQPQQQPPPSQGDDMVLNVSI